MKIINVKDMINEGIKKSKVLREALIKAYWKEIVGKLHKKSEVINIKNETLFVRVDGSANLHFMAMKKTEYIESIKKLLNGNYILNINYRVGKINLNSKIENEILEQKNNKYFKNIDFSRYSLEERIKMLSEAAKKREFFLLDKGYKKCLKCKNLFLGKELICPKCRGEKEKTVINKY